MTNADYTIGIADPTKKTENITIEEKHEVIILMPTDKQLLELEKIISVRVEKRVREEVADIQKRVEDWIKDQDKASAATAKRNRAGEIAQRKHMSVVEGYLKNFNKLLGRKK